MSDMEYKGYRASVSYDASAEIFHSEVLNTRTVLTFQGNSVDELKAAFRDTVDDYLAWCRERGKDPEKPYSGRFVLRMSPELHRRLATDAVEAGKSLNALIQERLEASEVKRE